MEMGPGRPKSPPPRNNQIYKQASSGHERSGETAGECLRCNAPVRVLRGETRTLRMADVEQRRLQAAHWHIGSVVRPWH